MDTLESSKQRSGAAARHGLGGGWGRVSTSYGGHSAARAAGTPARRGRGWRRGGGGAAGARRVPRLSSPHPTLGDQVRARRARSREEVLSSFAQVLW